MGVGRLWAAAAWIIGLSVYWGLTLLLEYLGDRLDVPLYRVGAREHPRNATYYGFLCLVVPFVLGLVATLAIHTRSFWAGGKQMARSVLMCTVVAMATLLLMAITIELTIKGIHGTLIGGVRISLNIGVGFIVALLAIWWLNRAWMRA